MESVWFVGWCLSFPEQFLLFQCSFYTFQCSLNTFTFVAKYQVSYLLAYLCSLSIHLLCGEIFIELIYYGENKYLKFDELDVDTTTWVKEILQMVQ